MDKVNFIRTSDAETITQLKKLGFQVFQESNGITIFINHTGKKLDFNNKKIVYTNNLNV